MANEDLRTQERQRQEGDKWKEHLETLRMMDEDVLELEKARKEYEEDYALLSEGLWKNSLPPSYPLPPLYDFDFQIF